MSTNKGYLMTQTKGFPVPSGAELVTLHNDQLVKINGIPFFLLGDVQAYSGSKGNVVLAFEPQPGCSE